jgi:hypothetical protein
MEPSMAEQILDELLPSFEALETQSGAILQFLKDKGTVTDEQFAPYIEQARSASVIRWRAVRLRMNRLLAPAFKEAEAKAERKADTQKTTGELPQSEREAAPEAGTAHKEPTKKKQPGEMSQKREQSSSGAQLPNTGRSTNGEKEKGSVTMSDRRKGARSSKATAERGKVG